MPVKKLKKFLDDNHVKYVSIMHSKAYTADQVAQSAHIPGKEMAKTVMVTIGPKMAMAVLPASYQVDFNLLRDALHSRDVNLADESEFKNLFPDCEVGAMPPFGNLYGMEVFVDATLSEDKEICFNAGSHTELFKLAYTDFVKLVNPVVTNFAAGVMI